MPSEGREAVAESAVAELPDRSADVVDVGREDHVAPVGEGVEAGDDASGLTGSQVDPVGLLDFVSRPREVGGGEKQRPARTAEHAEPDPEQPGIAIEDADVVGAVLDLLEQGAAPPQVALVLPPTEPVGDSPVPDERGVSDARDQARSSWVASRSGGRTSSSCCNALLRCSPW